VAAVELALKFSMPLRELDRDAFGTVDKHQLMKVIVACIAALLEHHALQSEWFSLKSPLVTALKTCLQEQEIAEHYTCTANNPRHMDIRDIGLAICHPYPSDMEE
jgi:hypothetical protein